MPKVLTKSATLTLRIDPAVKGLLSLAAEADRRSQANMVEVMVIQYCEQRGLIDKASRSLLAGPDTPAQDKNQTKGTA